MGRSLARSTTPSSSSPSKQLSILQWNIQGLLGKSLEERTDEVVKEINRLLPDVVMLQEVVKSTLQTFCRECPEYLVISPSDFKNPSLCNYFVALMVRKSTFKFKSKSLVKFPNSIQGRNLLVVNGTCCGHKVSAMTSHLESTVRRSEERIEQLINVSEVMKAEATANTVILGGDLNLIDAEAEQAKTKSDTFANHVEDVWTVLGEPVDSSVTWDAQANDNQVSHDQPEGSKARLRLDRLYMRKESENSKDHFKPLSMQLVGLERLPCGFFPSDHWGILLKMHVDKK